jgi:predicted Fe-Mo cluster-binding NifX family protein
LNGEGELKIAISSEGPDLEASVWHRFGTAPYWIIVDLETRGFESIPNPATADQTGGGTQAAALLISQKVDLVLTGYCSPFVESHLSARNVLVVTGISGTVGQVINEYKRAVPNAIGPPKGKSILSKSTFERAALKAAFRRSARQFTGLLPILASVLLLMGLFSAFVPKHLVHSIFTGRAPLDTVWGACFGSLFTGNPVNSYVIGGEMLEQGISLYAVTALMTAWVTVGLIQLPAETAAMGKRFALVRNGVSFVLSILIAIATVTVWNSFRG